MLQVFMQLQARDVDFSTNSIEKLKLMHRQGTYPPRIEMRFVTAPQQTLTLCVQVKGTDRDEQLSADLLLPFVDSGEL